MKKLTRRLGFLLLLTILFVVTFTMIASASDYTYTLSSGLFGIPANAASVDWAIVNNSTVSETFRVTVYRVGGGVQKVAIPPGALTQNLKPGYATHNANNVGNNGPFIPGFDYEVVVETNSMRVLPTVSIWTDKSGTVMPGTTIPPGDFVSIQ